jgi:hypothetical protein
MRGWLVDIRLKFDGQGLIAGKDLLDVDLVQSNHLSSV